MSYDSALEIQDQQVYGEFGGVNPSITDSSTFTLLKPDTMKELLHIGKYENINLTSNQLENYKSKNGYVINRFHEEIYIKGRCMFFKGNPEKYLTLIRYPEKN